MGYAPDSGGWEWAGAMITEPGIMVRQLKPTPAPRSVAGTPWGEQQLGIRACGLTRPGGRDLSSLLVQGWKAC